MPLSLVIRVFDVQVGAINGIPFTTGMNVQQAMEAAYNLGTDPAFHFTLEYFGSLGYEVTMLDGLSAQVGSDAGTYLFWELLRNGTPSDTGIDATFPDDGDELGWSYTSFVDQRHLGTRHDEIRSVRRQAHRIPGAARS